MGRMARALANVTKTTLVSSVCAQGRVRVGTGAMGPKKWVSEGGLTAPLVSAREHFPRSQVTK